MFSNQYLNDIIKIDSSLEDTILLIKNISETIQNEAREQKGGFLGLFLSPLGASLLGNLLTDREMKAKIPGKGVMRQGEGTVRADKGAITTIQGRGTIRADQKVLMPPHPLTKFEMQQHYQNERTINCVYSRNNLPKIKHGAYVINLDGYKPIGTHLIALYVNGNNGSASYDATYLESFGVEHIPKEIKKIISNKNIITNIYRIQAYLLIMHGHFCVGFLDIMLKGLYKDHTNLFSPNDYEKNYKIILKYFH